jgi:hypothetical protein
MNCKTLQISLKGDLRNLLELNIQANNKNEWEIMLYYQAKKIYKPAGLIFSKELNAEVSRKLSERSGLWRTRVRRNGSLIVAIKSGP